MRRWFPSPVLLFALSGIAVATPARGQSDEGQPSDQPAEGTEPSSMDASIKNSARELALEAHRQFEARDFVKALDLFERAHKLVPAPTLLLWQARALVEQGRLVEGAERYETLRRTPVQETDPPPYAKAVEDGNAELTEVRGRIPKMIIRLVGPAADQDGVKVLINGQPMPDALVGVEQSLDPKPIVVTAQLDGQIVDTREITLQEKRVYAVDLNVAATTGGAAPDTGKGTDPLVILGIGSLGLAAVGVVVGTITGVGALDKKSTLDDICTPTCPPEAQSDADSFSTQRTISYISFGSAIAFAGLGTVLLIMSGGDDPEPNAAVLQPVVGPRWLGVQGQF